MKVEKMLNLSADSERLGGIGDMLSIQVNEVRKKYESGKMIPLSDEELELVAGGRPTRRSVCPRCGQKAFIIRFKRFECTSCHYVQPFA